MFILNTVKLISYKLNFFKSKISKVDFSQLDASKINYFKLNIGLMIAFVAITIASNIVSAVRSQPVVIAQSSQENLNKVSHSTNGKMLASKQKRSIATNTHSKKGVIHKKNKKYFSAKEIKKLKLANSSSGQTL